MHFRPVMSIHLDGMGGASVNSSLSAVSLLPVPFTVSFYTSNQTAEKCKSYGQYFFLFNIPFHLIMCRKVKTIATFGSLGL